MAYERQERRRRTRSAVSRAWLLCLALSVPGIALALVLIYREGISTALAILAIACLLIYMALVSASLID